MVDSKTAKVKVKNYIRKESIKTKIVLGSSLSYGLKHIEERLNRVSNSFPIAPHYTILKDGTTYKHFDEKYYSKMIDCVHPDSIISIVLESTDYLTKSPKGIFDPFNNLYKGEVFEREWKGKTLWQKYTKEQFNAAVELCGYLCNTFNIERSVQSLNIFKNDITTFKGIAYRSNFNVKYLDLNPSWEFKAFKETIENERE